MIYKWIGAALVMAGCGGWGFGLAARRKRQERMLEELEQILSFMKWELEYRLTPLPELCRRAGRETRGSLRQVFRTLADQLDGCRAPEVSGCMRAALAREQDLPGSVRRLLSQLGRNLGRFDLPGQLQGIEAVRAACLRERDRLSENREEHLRSIRTLGVCAGAALVILFV